MNTKAIKEHFHARYGKQECEDIEKDYLYCANQYSCQAADAFIEEFGTHLFNSSNFEDAFLGAYDSKRQYIEDLLDSYNVPDFLVIDWDLSFDNREEIFCSGFVFNSDF